MATYTVFDEESDFQVRNKDIEVVVTFFVVNFFGFSKITRYHGGFEGRH